MSSVKGFPQRVNQPVALPGILSQSSVSIGVVLLPDKQINNFVVGDTKVLECVC